MIGFLKSLFTGGIGSAAQGIARGVATFTGDKVQIESNVHDEAMAVHGAYSSENSQYRENRTWWDSLWDGLNRAPRPIMALGVVGMMTWPVFDPVSFAAAMQAYALVPEWLAYVFLAIVGFYFTSRHLEKVKMSGSGPTPAQVGAILETQRNIRSLRGPSFEEEMVSTAPMSNQAILEWNARRKQ